MKRKIAVLLAAGLVSTFGAGFAASCASVEDEVRDRAREEVDKQRQRVEKEIDKQRQRAKDEVEKQRQRVEKRVEEATQRLEEGQ